MIPTTGKRRPRPEVWHVRLYVAGRTPKSAAAVTNVAKLCDEQLAGRDRLEVIDQLVALDMRLDG